MMYVYKSKTVTNLNFWKLARTKIMYIFWLEKFLLKELEKPSIIIMDNAPVHNKKAIRAFLKKRREGMPVNSNIEDLIMSYS